MATPKVILLACTVCVAALGAAARPAVFWASDPVQPDETVLVAGAGFGQNPRVQLVPLPLGVEDPAPGTGAGGWPAAAAVVEPETLQPTAESLKFVLPASRDPGAWLCRIGNRETEQLGPPFRLNAPVVYWTQGDLGVDRASSGGWLRVFGRCVGRSETPGRLELVRRGEQTGRIALEISVATPWAVTGQIPAELEAGQWQMCIHNGWGGKRGWTEAGTLTIAEPEVWPRTVFNVRDLGASGQGDYADLAGVQMALDKAAEAGGGVVYLPRGRYLFDGTLRLPRHTVLRGEGAALSALCWPDTDEPHTLIEGTDHFGVEDLALYASNYRHGIAAELKAPEAGHTFVRNVCLRAVAYRGHLKPEEVDRRFRASLRLSTGGGDSIRLGGENVEISGCDLYGSGRAFYLYGVRGGVVRDNRFYNGRWGWYCITGADGLVYENNVLTGADLMSTGGGLNCLGSIYSRNVYYAGNTVRLCHGWDREAMTSDAGGGPYHGPVAEAEGVRLVLPEKPEWRGTARWAGAAVFVLGGRGMGQHRRIASVSDDGLTITLDRPWDVPPDGSSIVTVTMLQENYLFIDNHFEDAGIALQYYGTSVNHVAVGNTSTRAGGFYNSGRWYHGYQPSWYCQFLGNEILEGNCYRFGPNNATSSGPSFLGTWGVQRGDNPAPLAYCTIHRRNRLRNNARIWLDGRSDEHPGLRDVVVEHNRVENTDVGLQVGRGCEGVLLRDNVFENVDEVTADPAKARQARAARRAALTGRQAPVFVQDFEKQTGRFYLDASGNGFPAVARGGSVPVEPGLEGLCGRFDGAAFLEIGDRSLLRFPQLTVAAWVLPDRETGRWGVVAKRNANRTCAFVLALNNGAVTFEATDDTGEWSYNLIGKPCLRPGEWNHVAAVCEEGASVRLYCNGQEVGMKKVSKPIEDNDLPLTIGFEAWGGLERKPGSSGNFQGLIDDVRIWSRCLPAEELRAESARLADAAVRDGQRRSEAEARRKEEAERRAQRVTETPGEQWELMVDEAFDGSTLAPRWQTLEGAWTLRDGVLRCGDTSFLALDKPLAAPVRIEFDGRSGAPSDLTAFLGTKADAYKSGYFVGFASNGNTANKILRLGEEVATNDRPNATPGAWHRVVCEVLADGSVSLSVDGESVLTWRDPAPVRTADTAGIIAWGEAEFDNLRIYTGE